MDGVLVVDKPPGMTSHDVVALARRALGERRIGHTGTLDPIATGVLPLACGRATRLVRFLSASDKDYEAGIRFGLTTDTYDITGAETDRTDRHPDAAAVEAALESLRGEYLQRPPPYSAKKVGGRRAYTLARRDEAVVLAPVPVHVTRAELVACQAGTATIRITCSAGFYVRSFAHTLGELVGTGACLETLRRTRSGEFDLRGAVSATELTGGAGAADRLIPLERLLPGFPAVVVTDEGRRHVADGRPLGPSQIRGTSPGPLSDERPAPPAPPAGASADPTAWYRILDAGGRLIALGTAGPGALHPSIVLI